VSQPATAITLREREKERETHLRGVGGWGGVFLLSPFLFVLLLALEAGRTHTHTNDIKPKTSYMEGGSGGVSNVLIES
jgi:UDP-N-acetylmuramyl pentapeptide phosphotransferase/UDP-N-acetylglucosamine-1-phosphate transferase